jgi:hypothetical protein
MAKKFTKPTIKNIPMSTAPNAPERVRSTRHVRDAKKNLTPKETHPLVLIPKTKQPRRGPAPAMKRGEVARAILGAGNRDSDEDDSDSTTAPMRLAPGVEGEFSEESLLRLSEAFQHSRWAMEPFRKKRVEAIKQFVGSNYSDNGSDRPVPLNLLQMATLIYRRQIAANMPQVLCTARYKSCQPKAENLSIALNTQLKDMDFEHVQNRWVTEAMFGFGVVKVALSTRGGGAEPVEAGEPYAESVDLDDFVIDMTARKWETAQFMGDRYLLTRDEAKKLGYSVDESLWLDYVQRTNETGEERAKSVEANNVGNYAAKTFLDVREFWDIWLPSESKIVTILADESGTIDGGTVVKVRTWTGAESGPYHLLSFTDVPGNIMPLSPVALLYDMHDLANTLFRKLSSQAVRQKGVTVVGPGGEEDAGTIRDSVDGDIIRSNDPTATKEVRFGGVDANTLAFLIQTKGLYSWLGGNIDTLGGLATASDTVGQERIIKQASSMLIADMQGRTASAVRKVIEAVATFLLEDPDFYRDIEKPIIEGGDFTVKTSVGYEDFADENLLDYAIEIAPYSMQSRTPAERLATITQAWSQYVLPLAPALAPMGMVPDVDHFLTLLAQYSNTPEIAELIKQVSPAEMQVAPPPPGGTGGAGAKAPGPPSSRSYVRSDRGNSPDQEATQAAAQIMNSGAKS